MAKYRVFMKKISYMVGTFEAENAAEAKRLAEEADGSCFEECPDPEWEFDEAIKED